MRRPRRCEIKNEKKKKIKVKVTSGRWFILVGAVIRGMNERIDRPCSYRFCFLIFFFYVAGTWNFYLLFLVDEYKCRPKKKKINKVQILPDCILGMLNLNNAVYYVQTGKNVLNV